MQSPSSSTTPLPLLRAVSSTSSLRLGLHASKGLFAVSASNNIDIIPSFADTTIRWTGSPHPPPTGTSPDHNSLDKQSTEMASTSTSFGFGSCPAASPDLEDDYNNITVTLDNHPPWSGDRQHTPVRKPQRAVLGPSSSSRSSNPSGSGSPPRPRPQQQKRMSRSRRKDSPESDEELERELMEDHYSSMEQMLAKNGFQDCRVCTPPTAKPVATAEPTTNMAACSHPLSKTLTNTTSATSTSSIDKNTMSNFSSSSLRAKTSILSFSGLVSTLWGAVPATTKAVTPSTSTVKGVKGSVLPEEVLNDERKETIRGWVAQTAAAALDGMPTSTVKNIAPKEGEEERSAESLVRESSLRHVVSEGSIPRIAGQETKEGKRPSLASIFGSVLPASSSSSTTVIPPAAITASAQAPSPSPENSTIQEPTKPLPAAHPEPRILRKTASQHTLRVAASPVLSITEAVPSSSTSSTTSNAATTPIKKKQPQTSGSVRAPLPRTTAVRDGLPRSDSSPVLGGGGTPERNSPRYVAHRNPRDSPIGETKVLKGAPPLARRTSLQQQMESPGKESVTRKARGGSKGPSILDDAEDNEGLWTPPRRSSTVSKPLSPLSNNNSNNGTVKKQLSSQQPLERPKHQLRAKESLEHILATRQKQEQVEQARSLASSSSNNNSKAKILLLGEEKRAKEEIQRRQQSTAGRKALAQLSSFHRSPLPVGREEQLQQQVTSNESKKDGMKGDRIKEVDGSKGTFSGTLKGLFGSAMDWIAEDPEVPFPVHVQRKPNNTNNHNSSTLPTRGRGAGAGVKQRPSLSNMDGGKGEETVNLRGGERRKKAASVEEQRRRSRLQSQSQMQMNVPTIVIHEPTPTTGHGM